MKKVILFVMLAGISACGATFTSTTTGNWHDGTTWGNSGAALTCPNANIPCSGDIAKIATGTTVTCETGLTCVIGNSPSSDSTANAVLLPVTSTSTTAGLIVNGTLQIQGPVRMGCTAWTFNAGSALVYDSSNAAAPTTVGYTWATEQSACATPIKLVFSGTAISPITVSNIITGSICTTAVACRFGGIGNSPSSALNNQGMMDCSYTTFTGMGLAAGYAYQVYMAASSFTWDHCSFDQSSTVVLRLQAATTSTNFTISGLKITLPSSSTSGNESMLISQNSTPTYTGTGVIQNSTIQGEISHGTGMADPFTWRNILLEPNELGSAHQCTGANACIGFVPLTTATMSTDQMMIYNQDDGELDVQARMIGGTHSNAVSVRYIYIGQNSNNMHPIVPVMSSGAFTFDRWVYDGNAPDQVSDNINSTGNGPSAGTALHVTNSVAVCGIDNLGLGSFINHSATTPTNNQLKAENNTMCSTGAAGATLSEGLVLGVGWEVITPPADFVQDVINNVIFNGVGSEPEFAVASGGTTANAILEADYNGIFNNSLAKAYNNNANGSTDTTSCGASLPCPNADVVIARQPHLSGLAENGGYGRHFIFFDTGYWNVVNSSFDTYIGSATAWTATTAYVVGDLVYDQNSGAYGSARTYWRCIGNNTAATGNRPLTGTNTSTTSWQHYWEPAVMVPLRKAVIDGVTFRDGGIRTSDVVTGGAKYNPNPVGIIGAVNAYIRSGYRANEPSLWVAGKSGAEIGIPVPKIQRMFATF